MKKIGLFYATSTAKTADIAKKIQKKLGEKTVDLVCVETAWEKEFEAYEYYIVGTSTWFDGELPTYWDELIPKLGIMNFKNKKVAVFGLGDQKKYPDNFADGVGHLAKTFEKSGAKLVGLTSTDNYSFNESFAIKNNQFLGLVIDFENQGDQIDERISQWVEQLKKEFEA